MTRKNISSVQIYVLLFFSSLFSAGYQMPVLDDGADDPYSNFTNDELQNMSYFDFIDNWTKNVALPMFPAKQDLKKKNTLSSSFKCVKDLLNFYNALKNKKFWAMFMFDAFGKPESNIGLGNFRWSGDFSLCQNAIGKGLAIQNDTAPSFKAQFCWMEFSLSSMNFTAGMPPFNTALCIPNSCSETVMLYLMKTFVPGMIPPLKPYLKQVEFRQITCLKKKKMAESMQSVIAIVTICVLGALVAIGTLVELLVKMKYKNRLKIIIKGQLHKSLDGSDSGNSSNHLSTNSNEEQIIVFSTRSPILWNRFINIFLDILSSFSIFTNYKKIFQTRRSESSLPALHGVRAISMFWVTVLSFASLIPYVNNIGSVLDKMNESIFLQTVAQGVFAVDTFFLLGGLLVTYNYFRIQESHELDVNFSWIYYYVHRYIRLTPALAFAIIVYVGILPYISFGPFTPSGYTYETCSKSWWWNILYINNFQNATEMCFPMSWYLANDMQFYFVAPMILIPLTYAKFVPFGFAVGIIMLFASWICTGIVSANYEFPAGIIGFMQEFSLMKFNGTQIYENYFENLFIKPYCRIGPYIIGMFSGWFLVKCKGKLKMNKILCVTATCMAIVVNCTLIFGLHHFSFDTVLAAIYEALSRTAWALAVGWIIIACCTGNGGPINKFLSLKLWLPISRLTYCAYLFQLFVMQFFMQEQETMIHFTYITMMYIVAGTFIVSYIMAFFVAVAVEYPIISLEKVILGAVCTRRSIEPQSRL